MNLDTGGLVFWIEACVALDIYLEFGTVFVVGRHNQCAISRVEVDGLEVEFEIRGIASGEESIFVVVCGIDGDGFVTVIIEKGLSKQEVAITDIVDVQILHMRLARVVVAHIHRG
jgi:hypothetical protein